MPGILIGIEIGIEALDALLLATTHANQAMQAINAMIQTAHSENRDLTDDEVRQVIQHRKDAEAKLQAAATVIGTVPTTVAQAKP